MSKESFKYCEYECSYKMFFDKNPNILKFNANNTFILYGKKDNEIIKSNKLKLKIINIIKNTYEIYDKGDDSKTDISWKTLECEDNGKNVKVIITGVQILDDTDKVVSYGSKEGVYFNFNGGRKVNAKASSVKKEVCGKLRCIYKIPGSRKEHLKYKGQLITVADYKKLMKAKS
uniref:Uncharacterized protein n=1 Tax=viral metagenome TaxID=1070528 RepID=A0A6C0LMH1_9ZZZZ